MNKNTKGQVQLITQYLFSKEWLNQSLINIFLSTEVQTLKSQPQEIRLKGAKFTLLRVQRCTPNAEQTLPTHSTLHLHSYSLKASLIDKPQSSSTFQRWRYSSAVRSQRAASISMLLPCRIPAAARSTHTAGALQPPGACSSRAGLLLPTAHSTANRAQDTAAGWQHS